MPGGILEIETAAAYPLQHSQKQKGPYTERIYKYMPPKNINHLEIDLSSMPIKVLVNGDKIPLSNVQSIDIHLDVDSKYVDINKTERYLMTFS